MLGFWGCSIEHSPRPRRVSILLVEAHIKESPPPREKYSNAGVDSGPQEHGGGGTYSGQYSYRALVEHISE